MFEAGTCYIHTGLVFWTGAVYANSMCRCSFRLGSSLGTTLCNASQAKRASLGFIGQAERTRGTK